MIVAGIIIITFLCVPLLAFIQNDRILEVRKMVESFCKMEFEANEFNQRVKLIKFSATREKQEKKRTGPALPWVLFWDWDSYYIVSSYKVDSVKVKDDRAVAIVEYKLLGRSKGKGRIISSDKQIDIVKLNLVFDGKKWWIYDPPLPKISKKKLIELYEHQLQHQYNEKWFSNASNAQKENYFKAKEALKSLKNLME